MRQIVFTQDVLGVKSSESNELIVSHREGLTRLPKGWLSLTEEMLITSVHTKQTVKAIEAMKHIDHPWWGFQAHIDAVPQFLVNNQISVSMPIMYAGKVMVNYFLNQVVLEKAITR